MRHKLTAVLELYVMAGANIADVCQQAVESAEDSGQRVYFEFKGRVCYASPTDDAGQVYERWASGRSAMV